MNATKLFALALTAALLAVCGPAVAQDAGQTWSFSEDDAGMVPRGWNAAQTAGQGLPASWAVVEDANTPDPPKAVVLAESHGGSGILNLLLEQGTSYQDLELSVKVKALTGKAEQGGGCVWRALDAKNYYAARWNPLDGKFRVYVIQDGKRRLLGSADVKADAAAWHTIKIRMRGDRISAQFDDGTFIEAQDGGIMKPGQIGLWAKGDASTAYDQVSVGPAAIEPGEASSAPVTEVPATANP